MPEIGATLREARMHARIDVSEIEAQTKIRAKYLRALENEEWSLLPGPTFVKSFLRTYAQALGLDGKALVEEYRLHHERPSEGPLEPLVSSPARGRSRSSPRGPSRGYLLAVAVTAGVIILLVVLLLVDNNGGSPKHEPTTVSHNTAPPKHKAAAGRKHKANPNEVTLALAATTEPVYVCLRGEHERTLIHGEELQPGKRTRTYHARHFLMAFGNGSVTMYIDGHARTVEPTTEAIGFSLTKRFGRHTLTPEQLPSCK